MDEDQRTLWCGNLSEKVTEEILYELFLQGGPVQNVTIPKDRAGKQRTFGFITYKHISSVPYALSLFDDTMLFNRRLHMNTRNNIELPQIENVSEQSCNLNQLLQLGQNMLLGNNLSHIRLDPYNMNSMSQLGSYSMQADSYPKQLYSKDDRRSNRIHPYHRDHDRNSSHHHKDHRSRSNRSDHQSRSYHNNHHSSDYSRSSYKSSTHNYR